MGMPAAVDVFQVPVEVEGWHPHVPGLIDQ